MTFNLDHFLFGLFSFISGISVTWLLDVHPWRKRYEYERAISLALLKERNAAWLKLDRIERDLNEEVEEEE